MSEILTIPHISLELTRLCNQQCISYCSKGPMQDLSMSLGTAKNILNDSYQTNFGTVSFTGGEAILNPDTFIFILFYFIEKNISIRTARLTTNGIELMSEDLKKALIIFKEYLQSIDAGLRINISSDSHHAIPYKTEIYKEYISWFGKEVVKLYDLPSEYISLYKPYLNDIGEDTSGILNSGFATGIGNRNIIYPPYPPYVHKRCNNGVDTYSSSDGIYISANGNIVSILEENSFSYEKNDEAALGNINDESLLDCAKRLYLNQNGL